MFFISFIIFNTIVICTTVRYDNYTYIRAIPSQDGHLDFFRVMKNKGYDMNFWSKPGRIGKPIEFTIAPGNKSLFLENAKKLNMPVFLLHNNIQSLFDEEKRKFNMRTDTSFNWEHYFGLNDIYAWLKDLAKKRGPEIKVQSIGTTIESRNILAAKIILNGSSPRSKVVIEGGIHAREWISPAVVTFLIAQILDAANSKDEQLKKIAMTYEWHFVPVLNPDGYEYSHTQDRLWRKNRHGRGVDLNRNFGHKFGVASSINPNYESYCGPNAFSEKESLAWSNYIKYIGNDVEYYFAFHSYSQFMIMPYGYTKRHLENYNEVYKMASEAAVAIKSKNNRVYRIGNAYETVGYIGGGMSVCWAKHTFKIPYALTFELPDQGFYGFALPARFITPTCNEILAGLISLLRPRDNSLSVAKDKYEKSVEKYHSLNGSGRVVFFKTLLVFSGIFSNKLLGLWSVILNLTI